MKNNLLKRIIATVMALLMVVGLMGGGVEVSAAVTESATTVSFDFTTSFDTIQGTTGTFTGTAVDELGVTVDAGVYTSLGVDATASNGKFYPNGNSAQVGEGTVFSIPVAGDCSITVNPFSGYEPGYTIDDETVAEGTAQYTYNYEGDASFVEMEITSSGKYVISITVSYAAGVDFTVEPTVPEAPTFTELQKMELNGSESYNFKNNVAIFDANPLTEQTVYSENGYIKLDKGENESLCVTAGNNHGLECTSAVTFTAIVPAGYRGSFGVSQCKYAAATATATVGEEVVVESTSIVGTSCGDVKTFEYNNESDADVELVLTVTPTGAKGFVNGISYSVLEHKFTTDLNVSGSVGTALAGGTLTFTDTNSSSNVVEATVAEDGTYAVVLENGTSYKVVLSGVANYWLETTLDLSAVEADKTDADFTALFMDPEAKVAEGIYDFQSGTTSYYNVPGMFCNENVYDTGNSHGLQTVKNASATIELQLAKAGTIYVTTCCYGSGAAVPVTASAGTLTSVATSEVNGSVTGQTYTITDATGDVVLTLPGDMYIHSIEVKYVKEDAGTKIDVWDFGTVAESNTEVYNNNITTDTYIAMYEDGALGYSSAKGGYRINYASAYNIGDLSLLINKSDANDYLYSATDVKVDIEGTSTSILSGTSKSGYMDSTYAANNLFASYKASGCWMPNGTGKVNQRAIAISCTAGDVVTIYASSQGATSTAGLITPSGEEVTVDFYAYNTEGGAKPVTFIATETGKYTLYSGLVKPMYHRVVRVPGIKVTGTVDLGENVIDDYEIKFVNTTTEDEFVATVNEDGTYNVVLAEGYSYTAVFSGESGYKVTDATKSFTLSNPEADLAGVVNNIAVESVPVTTVTGTIAGFVDEYPVTTFTMKLTGDNIDPVVATVNGDGTWSATIMDGFDYSVELTGADDYEVKTVINTTTETTDIALTAELKTLYNITGVIITSDGSENPVTKVTFANDAGYAYAFDVTDGAYTAKLRDGDYTTTITTSAGTTSDHVAVDGADATNDIYVVLPEDTSEVEFKSELNVGVNEEFKTINEALKYVGRMANVSTRTAEQTITLNLKDEVYMEQVDVDYPYITFKSELENGSKITWYYGIGYDYYSVGADGRKYDIERAYDKYSKAYITNNWGATVQLNKGATGFNAENIIFENSFNYRLTEEEIADGVSVGTQDSKADRSAAGFDPVARESKERACAMFVNYSDEVEFYNCQFLSSQDTVGTAKGTEKVYFKECVLEGGVDFICYDGSVVFDTCTLSLYGYSNSTNSGYIVAPKDTANGYLFINSTIMKSPRLGDHDLAPTYLGRPWGANGQTIFLGVKLAADNLIHADGWKDMSGAQPENARFATYNFISKDGDLVDTSAYKSTSLTDEEAAAYTILGWYDDAWTPDYYTGMPTIFAPVTKYNVTVTEVENGSATATPATAAEGATVTLEATPENGYEFDGWEVTPSTVTITNNQFVMPAEDVTVTPLFVVSEAPSFNVSVTTSGNGTAKADYETAQAGYKVTLTVIPDEGYEFDSWVVTSENVTITNNSFVMPAEDVAIVATFKEKKPENIDLALNVSTDLTLGTYTETFEKNGFTLYATAETEMKDGVEKSIGDLVVDSNSKTVDGVSYTQRLKTGGTGNATRRSIAFTTTDAATLELMAVSSSGSADRTVGIAKLDAETGELVDVTTLTVLGSAPAKYTYNLTDADTYYIYSHEGGLNIYAINVKYAEEAAEEYTVTVTADDNGTAKADVTKAAEGTTVTLTATPNTGYEFDKWEVTPSTVTITDNKFTMPAGDVTVNATFKAVSSDSTYVGNVNTELIKFSYNPETFYLSGEIVVVEWVNDVSTVPSVKPEMTFVGDNGEEIDVFVTPTGTNTYYFDRLLGGGLTEGVNYSFLVTSGDPNNVSEYKTVPVYTTTSPIENEAALGDVGNQTVAYKTATDGTLLVYAAPKGSYVGNVNSSLLDVACETSSLGNFVSGHIVVTEWVNGTSTVPTEQPKMRFKSTDGAEEMDVFMVSVDGTNTYYFDRNLSEDMDVNKEYMFTIELTEENNVSSRKTMVVTTNYMDEKEGILWETDTQVVKYKTTWNAEYQDNMLTVYAVNK